MSMKDFVYKAVFLAAVVVSASSGSSKDMAELIEHVLRLPNSDKVLNSVLGRLERNRQQPITQDTDDSDCIDSSEKHYPICHLERKIRKLNTEEFEYRPAYYEEVRCTMEQREIGVSNEICSSLGFSCVQWNKTIHLTRRRYSSECWETRTMVIPAGCECMWPVHRLGDMKPHV